MKKKKKKYYLIIEVSTKYIYGAFPFTEAGKNHADEYLKKINKNNDMMIKEV